MGGEDHRHRCMELGNTRWMKRKRGCENERWKDRLSLGMRGRGAFANAFGPSGLMCLRQRREEGWRRLLLDSSSFLSCRCCGIVVGGRGEGGGSGGNWTVCMVCAQGCRDFFGNRKSEIGNLIVECCVSFLFNFTTSALTTIILPATAANSTL